MDTNDEHESNPSFTKALRWMATCLVVAIAGVWLWLNHRDHVASILPYLLFLACPLFHLFGHGHGHGGHGGREEPRRR